MMIKRLVARADLLAPASFGLCLLLLVLDVVAFHLLGRRPLVSYPEAELSVWTALIACAWVWAARWLLAGERRARVSLAAAIALMLGMSALHPYVSGDLRETHLPAGEPALVTPPAQNTVVVEYTGGPMTSGRTKAA